MNNNNRLDNLMAKIEEHIRERRGDLLPFLDALAEDALQRSSWDELYYINAQRIVFSAKAMKVNQVLSLRQLQKDIEPRVSAEVVRDHNLEKTTLFAEMYLRAGMLDSAQGELQRLLNEVPIGSPKCAQIVELLAGLLYSRGNFPEAVQLWSEYVRLLEFYALLISSELIRPQFYPVANLLYSPGIEYLFETGDEAVRDQLARDCVRACQLVLSPHSRCFGINVRDTAFLEKVRQWLIAQDRTAEADVVARCIDRYCQSLEGTLMRVYPDRAEGWLRRLFPDQTERQEISTEQDDQDS
jgi:tetratricopeptide (TPR) repeat protein